MTMNATWEAALARAEFDFVEMVVRYHEGKASAAEVGAARKRLRELALRFERARTERELFGFPRPQWASARAAGH